MAFQNDWGEGMSGTNQTEKNRLMELNGSCEDGLAEGCMAKAGGVASHFLSFPPKALGVSSDSTRLSNF